jgi:catechol 2,3-dioxygenase-like lactoylglutathione lyase family enzyme
MEGKLELVLIPISEVDRAKAFYAEKTGFDEKHDIRATEEMRRPADATQNGLLDRLWDGDGGRSARLHLGPAPDRLGLDVARAELADRGVGVGETQDLGEVLYSYFSDPDGNGWALQQVPARD